jgi:hypothetical protein
VDYFELYHRLNPLHIYCRLLERGIKLKWALRIARIYEVTLFEVMKAVLKFLI